MLNLLNKISSLKKWQTLLLCIVLVLFFRSLTLHADILQVDEADFAAQGRVLASGGTPYVDFVEKKPPLSYAFYALPIKIFGNHMIAVHLFMMLWIVATGWGLFKIAEILEKPKAGKWAAIFYVVWTICFPATATLPANTENMLAQPSVLAVLVYLKACKNKKTAISSLWFLLAGLFVALASLFKHQGGILLAVFLADLILRAIRKEYGFVTWFKNSAILCMGFFLPWGLTMAIFTWKGAFTQLIEWNFINNARYISSRFDWVFFVRNMFVRTMQFALIHFPLVSLAVYAGKKCKDEPLNWKSLFILWLLGCMVAVSAGGRFSAHYYVQFYPPLVFLAALGFDRLLQVAAERRKLVVATFVCLVSIPSIFLVIHWASFFGRWFQPQHVIVNELAQAVKAKTNKGDRIFMWGYFPYIYYTSDRMPATRYTICEYVVPYWEKFPGDQATFDHSELTPLHLKNLENMLSDLKVSRPKIIVDMSGSKDFTYWRPYPMDKFPELAFFVHNGYHRIGEISGFELYERNE